jgi:hypothetical protein
MRRAARPNPPRWLSPHCKQATVGEQAIAAPPQSARPNQGPWQPSRCCERVVAAPPESGPAARPPPPGRNPRQKAVRWSPRPGRPAEAASHRSLRRHAGSSRRRAGRLYHRTPQIRPGEAGSGLGDAGSASPRRRRCIRWARRVPHRRPGEDAQLGKRGPATAILGGRTASGSPLRRQQGREGDGVGGGGWAPEVPPESP